MSTVTIVAPTVDGLSVMTNGAVGTYHIAKIAVRPLIGVNRRLER